MLVFIFVTLEFGIILTVQTAWFRYSKADCLRQPLSTKNRFGILASRYMPVKFKYVAELNFHFHMMLDVLSSLSFRIFGNFSVYPNRGLMFLSPSSNYMKSMGTSTTCNETTALF